MDDLIKSLKAQLYDRVTSPLLSSFLISWVLWNHRIFLVMFSSDLKVKQKFAYADEILYPTVHEVALRGFLWPLLSALALLFIYPIPSRWVYQYVRNEQKRLKEIQQKIDDETPVTQEEAKGLRAAIRKADSDFQKEIAERDSLIARLRGEIAALEKSAEAPARPAAVDSEVPDETPPELNVTLDDSQTNLLSRIARTENGLESSAAVSIGGKDRVHSQFNLDELIRQKLITHLRASYSNPSRYMTTAAGRAFLVNWERKKKSS